MDQAGGAVVIQVITQDDSLLTRIGNLAQAAEGAIGVSCVIQRGSELTATDTASHLTILDLGSMTDEILKAIPEYRRQGGSSWIVVTYPGSSNERLLGAMRMGANDYIAHEPEMAEFRSVLVRASQQGLASSSISKPTGSIISVFSNKGGVGTTMSTINLAASLAEKTTGSVVVVDLVLQHGDIAVFLDVSTDQNVVSMIPELDRADASFFQSSLSQHAAGMYVLPAPYHPDEAELVSATQITDLLQSLSQVFEYVVVDLGNGYSETTLAVLDLSELVFLVTLPSLPDVRNTRRAIDLFKRINFELSKVKVVINRHNAKDQIGMDTVQEGLGHEVNWTITNDFGAVIRSINEGTAIRMIQPKHPIAQNFDKLVEKFITKTKDDSTKPGKSLFGVKSLFGR